MNKNLIEINNIKNILKYSKLTDINNKNDIELIDIFNIWADKYDLNQRLEKFNKKDLDNYNKEIELLFKGVKPDSILPMSKIIKLTNEYLKTNALKGSKQVLTPLTFAEFMAVEDKKEYYVKDMFAKGTINMIFSPPAQMKSFVSYYLGLCMATGNDFLKQKTKKINVGYFDWENPISDIQNRVKGLCKGMNFDAKAIDNFYFFNKQPTLLRVNNRESYVLEELKDQLLDFVKENKIKVLFFDTLRRLGNFDENDSGAINTIKSELFDPLIKDHNVCIIFLHHTSKEGKQYRGSVDIEGVLDTAFMVEKKNSNDLININIKNTKRRNNELELLQAVVEIQNYSVEDDEGSMLEVIDFVKFARTEQKEESTSTKVDYKEIRDYFVENLDIQKQYRNKELTEILTNNFDINSSTTVSKTLKWFVNKDILKTYGEGKKKYYILNPSNKTEDQEAQLKVIEKQLHTMFKENEALPIEKLNDKFNEQELSLFINSWNAKGWINTAKKGYIYITDKYRNENLLGSMLEVENIEVKD